MDELLPRVLGDVFGDVGVIRHDQGNLEELGIQGRGENKQAR